MNRNLTGGYYLVSLDDVDLASESEIVLTDVAKLLYFAKKYKFVVFQDIVIDGEKKTAIPAMFEADMTLSTKPEDWDDETDGEFVPEELYTAKIYNVYDKNIAIDAEGVVSVTDYAVDVDPTTLYGKFVRVIDAPESTTLTDEQLELFKEGVFINGIFLGVHNPIIMPVADNGSAYLGSMISKTTDGGYVGITIYNIDKSSNVVSKVGVPFKTSGDNTFVDSINLSLFGRFINIASANSEVNFCGKVIPQYPAEQTNKTYVPKLVNGTLTWVEETA